MFFLSCNQDIISIDGSNNLNGTEIISQKTINFKGLVFKNSYNLSEKKLNSPKQKGFINILQEVGEAYYKSKGLSRKVSDEFDEDVLLEATRDMLPYFPFQEEGVNEEMILRDLPDLTGEIFEVNQELIDEYYNSSLDIAVANRYFDNTYVPYDLEILKDAPNFDYTYTPPVIPTYPKVKNVGETTKDCFFRISGIKYHHVRRMVAVITAARDADANAYDYYPNLNKVNTKRDAFRHTIWQALLSKYFWTTSSKKKKYDFAKEVGDWNEECGENAVGTRHMDYHNNEIGREIYQKHSSFITILWGSINIGVRNPSNATIYEEAQKQIENNSVFIDLDAFAGNVEEQEEKAYLEILKTSKTKSIYLSKEESDGGYYD